MTESKTDAINAEEQTRHADWPKMLEWIEKQAQESLKARFATSEILAKEAQTTLTVLLAGVGASGAYAAKIFEPGTHGPLAIASTIVCVYLTGVSAALVLTCMRIRGFPALYQDPKNLMHPDFSLDVVRELEVKNIGERIKEAKSLNEKRARLLNCLRVSRILCKRRD